MLLPLDERNEVFIAYSDEGKSGEWDIPDAAFEIADVYEITPEGNVPCGEAAVRDGKIALTVKPGQALAIVARPAR